MRVKKKMLLIIVALMSFLEAAKDHLWILEQVGYWKHQIQISTLFLVLLETREWRQYKNGAKKITG